MGKKHYDMAFEAKDRARPALPQRNKSDARQTIVPSGLPSLWALPI